MMMTPKEAALVAAVEQLGHQVIELERGTEHENRRWREAARLYNDLRDKHHKGLPEPKLDLVKLQTEVHAWEIENFGEQPTHRMVLGACEEVGELAHAQLKIEQAIRGTVEEHDAKAKDAIGDAVIFLLNLCSTRGWSFEQIVRETWAEVSQRDWKANPETGETHDGHEENASESHP